jgi:hypothetical protein
VPDPVPEVELRMIHGTAEVANQEQLSGAVTLMVPIAPELGAVKVFEPTETVQLKPVWVMLNT